MVWTKVAEPSLQLYEARCALHWALQVPAAFAFTFLPPRPDDNHMNFRWRGALGALTSHACPDGFRLGLRFADLNLLLFKDEALHSKYALVGKTLEQAYTWLASKLATDDQTIPLRRPGYDLPPHPVAAGVTFKKDELYREIAKWYGNAATVLEEVRVTHSSTPSGTVPVRCWPHHFDIATRLELDAAAHPESSPASIGVGMTPGDEGIAEPYWYVTPWPMSTGTEFPPLADGYWHTGHQDNGGWTGAVLTATDLTTQSADAQALQVEAFFRSAVAATRQLLNISN
ncbi:hypothetical protein BH24DEI2_BH24DEI2_24370 [soil metagenome]